MSTFLGLVCFVALIVAVVFFAKARKSEDKKTYKRNGIIAVVVMLVASVLSGATGGNDNDKSSESVEVSDETDLGHLYDKAEIVDMYNGTGTEVIGKVSVIVAPEDKCTEEALADWYFNYAVDNECNFSVIVYSDADETRGVYTNNCSFIEKNIMLYKESDGTYRLSNDVGATYYTCDSETKTLNVFFVAADEDVLNIAKEAIEGFIDDKYKHKGYDVTLSGAEGALDCNVYLVDLSLESADYEKITFDLATKINDANVGVAYFNIAFMSDEATLKAISGVDNIQEEISVKVTLY